MKLLQVFLLFFLLSGCGQAPTDNHADADKQGEEAAQERYFSHLEYLLQLKNDVAEAHWPDYSEQSVFLPAAYYTFEGLFVINPNQHILDNFDHREVPSFEPGLQVIKLAETYTDTTNFQFANSYGDDPSALYYQENVLAFSSFELTRKFIPDIRDIQDWSIMVLHELFHAYQRSIGPYKEYSLNLPIPGGPDEYLGKYHAELDWYRESVQRENELLLSVWKDSAAVAPTLKEYTRLREERINRIREEYGVDIREIEDYEIMIEGHARFFEMLTKTYIAENRTGTSMLSEADQALITGMFDDYDPREDKGLYDIYNDRYWYQLGYNISMILHAYLPEYRQTIYYREHDFNAYLNELTAGYREE